MWLMAMLAWAATVSPPIDGSVVEGVAFGPRLSLTCTWFTNFEYSRFEQCRGPSGNALPPNGGASIKCLGRTCEELDAGARKAAHWRRAEAPWGTFAVRLVGRVSHDQHPKQYIGDGSSTVLIERLLSVRRANRAMPTNESLSP